MADKNAAPKGRSSSKKRYLDSLSWRLPANRARRAKRHAHRMAEQAYKSKHCNVLRGTRRAQRRGNIVEFKQRQEGRRKAFTGTVVLNAPSLQALHKFIGRVGS